MQRLTNSHKRSIIILLLSLLILTVYWNTQKFDFINYDDQMYVTQNYQIQSGFSFQIFKDIHTANWHPLTILSHTFDWRLFGDKAGGHHWMNVMFHMLNAILLFWLLESTTGAIWRSAMVAALFAVHPINVESVAWVAERKNVLSTFFWILTMLFYVRYVRQPGWKRYVPVFLCFALGLMAKPMLVTLPFVLLLMDYWPLNRTPLETRTAKQQTGGCVASKTGWGLLIYEKIPLFILTAIFIGVTLFTQKAIGAIVSTDSLSLVTRMKNAIFSYGLYIKKMFWPLDLSVFYPQRDIAQWKFFIALVILLLISLFVLRYHQKRSYLFVGWFGFLGTLIPVIGLVQVGAQAMADRYAYVPFVGLFIVTVWLVSDIAETMKGRTAALTIFACFVILFLSTLSWQRCQLWGDKYALWNDVLKNYNVAFAYNMRALAYAGEGQHGLALTDYNAALQLDRKFSAAFINRGNLYTDMNRYEDALNDYTAAIRLEPRFADAFYNRGLLYLKLNRVEEAIADFEAAIKIDPAMEDYYNNRGVAFRMKGEHEKALSDFNKALSINQSLAEAYFNRGIVYYLHKEYTVAVVNFTEAVILKPRHISAYFYRGLSFSALGMNEYALRDFRRILVLDANNIETLHQLAELLNKLKRYDESLKYFRKILLIHPDDRAALEKIEKIAKLQERAP